MVIAAAGVGTAFVLNALSFAGVILVIARWKRPAHKGEAPAEHLAGATVAALRFVCYSPGIRAITLRSGIVMLFGSSLLALLSLRGGAGPRTEIKLRTGREEAANPGYRLWGASLL